MSKKYIDAKEQLKEIYNDNKEAFIWIQARLTYDINEVEHEYQSGIQYEQLELMYQNMLRKAKLDKKEKMIIAYHVMESIINEDN